jgi:tetratricopeptide (TPR) repeat protein
LADKKIINKKSKKISLPAKKGKSKPTSGSSRKNPPEKGKTSPGKAKRRIARESAKAAPARSQHHPMQKESIAMEAGSRRSLPKSGVSSAPAASPRLLSHTKTTSAALAVLEKSIQLLYQKELKKARGELKSLFQLYPGETEILARARSYIRICDREEASHKKPAITNDQLYALGVIEHNKANYDTAISYFLQSLENHPNADYIYYSMAASLAMKGNVTESIEHLRKAIALNQDSRIYAKNDNDFSALQSKKEFAELVGIIPPPDGDSQ